MTNSKEYIFKRPVLKQNILYSQVDVQYDFASATDTLTKAKVLPELEYIFQLICEHFSYVEVTDSLQYPDSVGFYWHHLSVLLLSFKEETDPQAIYHWNELVSAVTKDYMERLEKNEWGINMDSLSGLVKDCWRDFDVVDRKRLDVNKLINLILFVYDFCRLTLHKAKLHPNLYDYLEASVTIGGKVYPTNRRTADRIKAYMKNPYTFVGPNKVLNYDLPPVEYDTYAENPQAKDKSSYIAAMFIDIMHKFFSSFELKKRKGAEWSSAEVSLLYDLLRYFNICKSDRPAKESKYVTTTMNEYKEYYEKCSLYSWLRYDQEYSYLMNMIPEDVLCNDVSHE